MRLVALALADSSQRFTPEYPPKGSRLLTHPCSDIARLAGRIGPSDRLEYSDQRLETADLTGEESACLVHAELGQEDSARLFAETASGHGVPLVYFGPLATSWRNPPDWAGSSVQGDIVPVWEELRRDIASRNLERRYTAPARARYDPPVRPFGHWRDMNTGHQSIHFVVGCSCPARTRSLCRQHLYYGTSTFIRPTDEIVGEVLSMPGKLVWLDDDDVARYPEYYYGLFRELWNYRRHWVVRAGARLFEHPHLIRLLAKAGTKMVFLNDSFLADPEALARSNGKLQRSLYRRVKLLQSRRMLVAARLSVELRGNRKLDWDRLASALRRIDLDLLEMNCFERNAGWGARPVPDLYRPMLTEHEPAWVRNRFYGMGAIMDRALRRPRRTGFYTTAVYLMRYSLSHRQHFLEGLPSP